MGDRNLYDEDILAWSEQQAAALRRLAARGDLPNDLDLSNVIEEIADLGKGELCEVNVLLGQILTQLILAWADPTNQEPRTWAGDVIEWLSDMGRRLTPSMRQVIDLDDLWRDAAHLATQKLDIYRRDRAREQAASLAAHPCPFSLDDLCSQQYDVRGLLETLAAAAQS